MPNISTSNTNSIYKYTAQIVTTFENDENPITIDFLRFKSIVIDYNYSAFNFPLIYCNVNLRIEDQVKLADNQKNGTVVFTLQKYMENSDMPGLKTTVIETQCIYFIPQDKGKISEKVEITNPNKTNDLGDNITIGLIAVNHVNYNKTVANQVVKNGSMSSLLCHLLKDQTLLIEPLTFNTKLSNFALPPINTLSKMIRYLNNYHTFYDTSYRFFMDFDVTYLMSTSGQGLRRKGEECNIVKFIIKNTYDEKNMEGMSYEILDGMYNIECSATYCTISDSTDSSKSYSAYGGITPEGEIIDVETGTRDSNSPINAKTRNVRLPNSNTNLIRNMQTDEANSQILLNISKNKIDGSIITPNKQIYVDTTEAYGEKYTGVYLMDRKRELYLREGEGFAMSVLLFTKRIADQSNFSIAV